jgi:hypothetical protein
MRLWSIPFKYLDRQGLIGLWREALLAQNVLLGKTKGYKNHPQLIRFKEVYDPIVAIGQYLSLIADEAGKRGYKFNRSKIISDDKTLKGKFTVTSQQLAYEFKWLEQKLKQRDIKFYNAITEASCVPCEFFRVIDGPIEQWEVVK